MERPTNSPWRTSSYSDAGGNCVQVAELTDGTIAIRDSKTPHTATLHFPRTHLHIWLETLKRA
ncbi:DUF397 domain-containing protein [Streptomyces sp. 3MP-14]|uniref:DUF397 domain-containing protein n=1 Tax=Streptomyces mimosae TaxID=2586635 RepID=A0A5N6A5V2_9ACTN|nr:MULTISPECIES: DUF397 domain-containing protein [Streptomyces]KAB8164174.1 DUF397 domain-containing protein [Streptomyces mimosae]KAB8176451.1 DUF397 domain-containing protein [Streptomyces sp. 3MP-14]